MVLQSEHNNTVEEVEQGLGKSDVETHQCGCEVLRRGEGRVELLWAKMPVIIQGHLINQCFHPQRWGHLRQGGLSSGGRFEEMGNEGGNHEQ